MNIYLVPHGGLANRMRTVASSIRYCEQNNHKLNIIWNQDHQLHSSFDSLFLPLPDKTNLIEYYKLPQLYRVYFNNNLKQLLRYFPGNVISYFLQRKKFKWVVPYFTKEHLKKLGQYKGNVLIQSAADFFPYDDINAYFRPIPELKAKIEKNTCIFDRHTIGIHIRRTDHNVSITESPLEVFFKAMVKEIEVNPNVNFYLATDSNYVKKEILQKFGKRILTRNNTLSRRSTNGIREALIDLYSLSCTSKILGSYWSSFTLMAGEIGKIDVTELRRNQYE